MVNTQKKKQSGINPVEILQKQQLYQRLVLGRKQQQVSVVKTKKKNTPFSFSRLFSRSFGNQVGIDLGTATTVVYVSGKGVVMREPTLVAVNKRTDQVVAMGKRARQMIGRTPEHIEVIQPVQLGVINDYEITEQLFEHIF